MSTSPDASVSQQNIKYPNSYGFSPILYTVADGSYAANTAFSIGAAQVASFQSAQASGTLTVMNSDSVAVQAETNASVRENLQEGGSIRSKIVDVLINITIDRSAAAAPTGVTGNDELRVRSASGQRALPPPRGNGDVVLKMEAFDQNNALLDVDNGARLLSNGELALLESVSTAPQAVEVTDLALSTFNVQAITRIIISGSYLTAP